MDLSHLNLGMLGLVGAGLLASFWIVFKIAWKVVKIGFFIMSFCIGFAVCAALSTFTGHPQPIWALGGEALAFAWGFSLVRSKVAKVITGIAIVAMAQLVGKFGFDVNKFKDISQMPGAIEQSFLGQPAPVKQSAEHPKGSLSAAQKLAAQKAAHQKALKAKAARAKAAREKAAKEKASREEAAKAKAA